MVARPRKELCWTCKHTQTNHTYGSGVCSLCQCIAYKPRPSKAFLANFQQTVDQDKLAGLLGAFFEAEDWQNVLKSKAIEIRRVCPHCGHRLAANLCTDACAWYAVRTFWGDGWQALLTDDFISHQFNRAAKRFGSGTAVALAMGSFFKIYIAKELTVFAKDHRIPLKKSLRELLKRFEWIDLDEFEKRQLARETRETYQRDLHTLPEDHWSRPVSDRWNPVTAEHYYLARDPWIMKNILRAGDFLIRFVAEVRIGRRRYDIAHDALFSRKSIMRRVLETGSVPVQVRDALDNLAVEARIKYT